MNKIILSTLLISLQFLAQAQVNFEATPEYGKLWDITYDQITPGRVFSLSSVNHILVSQDNGVRWTTLYSFANDKANLSSLKIAPGGNALTFTASNNTDLHQNGLYVLDLATNAISDTIVPPNWADNPVITTYSIHDAGDSVILLNTFYEAAFTPSTKVFYTTNAGTGWKEVYYSGDNDGVEIHNSYISPADAGKLFLTRGLGEEGVAGSLLISADSGTTWVKKLEGVVLDPLAFNPSNPDDIWVGTANDDVEAHEALYHSTDGGSSWHKSTNLPLHSLEFGLNNFDYIKFDPSNTQTIWVLEENEYLKTTDGGDNWQSTYFSQNDPAYEYGHHITINPFNSNQLFITSDAWPQYSADGGATLNQAKNPFYNILNVDYAKYKSSTHIYYASQGGYFDKNVATGVTAHYLLESPFTIENTSHILVADTNTEGRVFVYTPGNDFGLTAVMAISDDYGATLHPIPADDYSAALERVEKDPNDNYTYWASFSAFGSGTLFKINAKHLNNPTSLQISTPTSFQVEGIYITPAYPDSMLITEGATVYSTNDGGTTWMPKTKGLEALSDDKDAIWDMRVNPFNNNQFII